MSFILDTNAVSESTKLAPNRGFVEWLGSVGEDEIFISVATLVELRYGIELLPMGARRKKLAAWLGDEVMRQFAGRILTVDAAAADTWAVVLARARAAGRPAAPLDGCIAAIALLHRYTLVTRNVADFEPVGVRTHNPWT